MKPSKQLIKFALFTIGLIVLCYSIFSFIQAFELYSAYRFDRDFNGCIFVGRREFPWLELISPLIFGLIGIILLKNLTNLLRFTFLFSFIFCTSTILLTIIQFVWCNISLIGYEGYCLMEFQILELGGILFFIVVIAEYRKLNWKKELSEFGLQKYFIGIVLISTVWFLLYKF